MEEVKAKKPFGRKATMWSSSVGTVTQTDLTKMLTKAMKDGYTISIGDVTYTKVSDGN